MLACAIALIGCGSASDPRVEQRERTVPATPLWGFDTASGISGRTAEDLLADIERADRMGANAVRIPLYWTWLEPDGGAFHPEHAAIVDRLFDEARQRDLGVIVTLTTTPCWATSAPAGCADPAHGLSPPTDSEDYGAFVGRIVTRWGAQISGLEVWNEPNHEGFWRGSPSQYMELVRAASEAVDRSPYAALPVVGGSTSGADLTYLGQLLAAGIANYTDAIAIHPYDVAWSGAGFMDPAIPRDGDLSSFAYAVPAVRQLMDDYGDPDPIWITEFGYPDCPATPHCVSAAEQSEYLTSAAELAASWPYVDVFLVYRLRDWLPQDGGMEGRFGILDLDGDPKPAAEPLGRLFERLTAP